MSLTQSILEQHALGRRVGTAGSVAVTRVHPDLLLADRESLRMPLGRFAALGAVKPAVECLVASDVPGGSGAASGDPTYSAFASLAREAGMFLAPPRSGDRGVLALESFAAPGRLLASLGRAPESGALGALVIPVGELEALALMLGDPLDLDASPVRRIELTGTLPARCEGHDLAGALIAAHPRRFEDAIVEFGGEVSALTITDRIAITRVLTAAGARSVIFPSDERTREHLLALGREADWRRTEAGPPREGALSFDLGWTVPHAISATRPTRAVPIAWWNEVAVAAVEVGPGLAIDSLARFAALLRGRSRSAESTLTIHPASGLDASAAEAAGAREVLLAAGARWLREGDLAPRPRPDSRLRVMTGAPPEPANASGDDWCVSLVAAAEAVARGRIESPHRWGDPREIEIAAAPVRAPFRLPALAGRALAETGAGARRRSPPPAAGLRGAVIARLDGDLDDDTLLPFGPRLAETLADPARLADSLLPAARRAPTRPGVSAAGGWLLVLGEVRHIERREAGLLALASLGVRGVLAAGFDPRARGRFARAGLLALRALRADDMHAVQLGDELELVGGLDAWVPDRARVVRDLTRAFAMIALPELTASEWDWVAAGGTAC